MHPALLVLLFYPLSAFGGLVTQLPPTTVYCGAGDFDSVNSDELGLLQSLGCEWERTTEELRRWWTASTHPFRCVT